MQGTIERCITCGLTCCYLCGNQHIESNCAHDCIIYRFHTHIGGYEVFEHLREEEETEKADLFNKGYPAILDLNKLKCPCGKSFLESEEATVCAACGSATCSALCHQNHIQSKRKCVFANNFMVTPQNELKFQGLRGIRLVNILAMQKSNQPKYTQCSPVSARFVFAALGPAKNTLYLQRGFRIYGSPCVTSVIYVIARNS